MKSALTIAKQINNSRVSRICNIAALAARAQKETESTLCILPDHTALNRIANCCVASGWLLDLAESFDLAALAKEEFELLDEIEQADWPTSEEARVTALYIVRSTGEFGAFTLAKGFKDSELWRSLKREGIA